MAWMTLSFLMAAIGTLTSVAAKNATGRVPKINCAPDICHLDSILPDHMIFVNPTSHPPQHTLCGRDSCEGLPQYPTRAELCRQLFQVRHYQMVSWRGGVICYHREGYRYSTFLGDARVLVHGITPIAHIGVCEVVEEQHILGEELCQCGIRPKTTAPAASTSEHGEESMPPFENEYVCGRYRREFKCVTTGLCVNGRAHCDGKLDCVDGSDEANCHKKGPGKSPHPPTGSKEIARFAVGESNFASGGSSFMLTLAGMASGLLLGVFAAVALVRLRHDRAQAYHDVGTDHEAAPMLA